MSDRTLGRRQILAAALAAPLLMAAPQALANVARPRDWRAVLLDRDRYLDLERPQSGEKARFYYYRKGQGWDARGYSIACTLLRDVVSKRTVQMDLKLLDLLWIISAHLQSRQLPTRIKIHSGFRTVEYNRTLKGASPRSMHLQGRAADIEIPGVSPEEIGKLARAIGVGGVGIYPSKDFVHVDIGKVRNWRAAVESTDPSHMLATLPDSELDRLLLPVGQPPQERIIYS
ncbi:YcbK family protein [Pseudomonas guariconensis]|uniref:YcbK family protein n=1 Tax=Pseudomonas guariconensis TaxID=1288410 RepID=UPI0039069FFB